MAATAKVPIEANIPRVLFVDDERSYLASVQAAAKDLEVHVETADSWEDGLKKVTSQKLAGVVCDWKMPGMDGIGLLERFHNLYPNLPLALQTGFALSGYEQLRLRQINAKSYPKGANVKEIVRGLLNQAGIALGGIEQLLEENRSLREFNQRLLADLKAGLQQIPNPSSAMIQDGLGGAYSVAELIRDIDEQNQRGREFVDWWLKARIRLRSMGRKS